MSQAVALQDTARPSTGSDAFEKPDAGPPVDTLSMVRLWAAHLLCFVLPLTTLAFLVTGPHAWWVTLAYFGVIVASVIIDNHAGPATHQPASNLPSWPFDGVLYLLTAVQVANVVLWSRFASSVGLLSVDAFFGWLIVGVNSGYSGIVVAHELIHRNGRHFQTLGRFLLATVLYEHFYTEHIRGHHARVGTDEDPATARFGERYNQFFLRTVPAQFRSAWRLECKRLGDVEMSWWDPRQVKNRVVHGLVAQVTLAAGLSVAFGWVGLAAFVAQAFIAIRLLEAVNYFEHYGLRRREKRVRPVDSWDTDSWFTLYTLVGLSRHADHHAFASRPYQKLRRWEQSPKLPRGYFGMVEMVLVNNTKFMKLMEEELRRVKLGPFEEPEGERVG